MMYIDRWEKSGFLSFLRSIGIPIFLISFLPSLHGFYASGTYPKEIDPQLALIGPSRIGAGQPIDLQLVCLGKDGNPCDPTSPPLILCQGPWLPDTPSEIRKFNVSCAQTEKGIFKTKSDLVLKEEGYYLLTAEDPSGVFLPFGLPIQVSQKPPALQLHWGDLHGHSTLSDGARPPEEYYKWARDVARLDMVALTDHNWALDEKKVEKKKELANTWYEPGKFVTFLSFEWAEGKARPHPSRGRPNHKHLIFRHTDENLLPWSPWQDTPSVQKLWEMLAGRDVIAIPHHTGLPHKTHYGTDWNQHNEQFERVAEIFSDWGSSEKPEDRYPLPEKEQGNFICDALKRGYRLGFAGGSDTHTSRPGLNTVPHQGHPH
ncbi:DUF3604 domain-containing protein, partial [Candidatus Sumerlaeota bacterium]|nr:DUF3604 domain-containing protein [Candidatus Sumerlaeota bacterium]